MLLEKLILGKRIFKRFRKVVDCLQFSKLTTSTKSFVLTTCRNAIAQKIDGINIRQKIRTFIDKASASMIFCSSLVLFCELFGLFSPF